MKNALLIAALTMVSASAFASKARLGALGGSKTVASDIQQVFEEPSRMWDLADQATFEFGGTGTAYSLAGTATNSTPNAEGGFIRSHENTKWGAYVGHQSPSLVLLLSGAGGLGTAMSNASLLRTENPLNLWYGTKVGDLNYGFNLYYASSERKTGANMNKKAAYGLSGGVQGDKWMANLVLGLGAKIENNTAGAHEDEEFKSDSSMKLLGEYAINDVLLGYAGFTMFGGTRQDGAAGAGKEAAKFDVQQISLGVESKIKSDTAHFFYGARIENATAKNKTDSVPVQKIEMLTMPVYFGLEADATSWLVLRTTLTQNVLLSSTKVTTAASSDADNVDSTVAASGLGFKFGKLMMDASMTAGTTGTLSSVDFGGNASLTYLF